VSEGVEEDGGHQGGQKSPGGATRDVRYDGKREEGSDKRLSQAPANVPKKPALHYDKPPPSQYPGTKAK